MRGGTLSRTNSRRIAQLAQPPTNGFPTNVTEPILKKKDDQTKNSATSTFSEKEVRLKFNVNMHSVFHT